ncbi:MAG: hypothetical protein AABP62_09870 [Planctomycetota bacterium]
MIKKLLMVILAIALAGVSGLIWPFQDGTPDAVLKRSGARFSYALDEKTIHQAWLEGPAFGDDEVVSVAKIPSLQWLSLAGTRITRRGVESLRARKGLLSLDLSRTQMTGEAFDVLQSLSSLAVLRLEGCHWVRDEHLAELASLKNLHLLDLSGTAVTPAGLKHLSQFAALRHLNLDHCPALNDEAVEILAGLSELRYLSLCGCEFTSGGFTRLRRHLPDTRLQLPPDSMSDLRELASRGKFDAKRDGTIASFQCLYDSYGMIQPLVAGDLAKIGALPELNDLNLDDSNVTDDMLLELGLVPSLRGLSLRNTAVTERSLRCLAGLPNLMSLAVTGTNIDAPGLKHLAEAAQLRRLMLESRQEDGVMECLSSLHHLTDLSVHAPITDVSLSRLSKLSELKQLELVNTHVTGAGLKHLSALSSLRTLCVRRGLLDDTAIEPIAGLTSLREVSLQQTNVTPSGRRRLLELRPDLDIRK